MFEAPNHNPPESVDAHLLSLSKRLVEARCSSNGKGIPGYLLADEIVFGLRSITREAPHAVPCHRVEALIRFIHGTDDPSERLWQQVDVLLKRVIFSIRTMIGGLIQGGLPAQRAYDFFTMDDLNLLFYVHGKLAGARQYPDIPFGKIPKVGRHDY